MKKLFVLFAVVAVFCSTTIADVHIPKEYRIPNQKPGRCVWASAECLGLTHGYKQLKGLTESNARRSNSMDAFRELRRLGIPVECSQQIERIFQWEANGKSGTCYSFHRIEELCKKDQGCCIGVWIKLPDGRWDKHMVVVIAIDKEKERAKIWDSNIPENIQDIELAWLYQHFDGWVMEIPPPKRD